MELADDDDSDPQTLVREFVHPDFIAGSKFVAKLAAVAQLQTHYPSIQLERRILSKQKAWQVVTKVTCHTLVLGGLSTHDFHLAMLIDVEAERPEVKELIIPEQGKEA
ncbi:Catalyzes the last two steps in the biosynthesis of 5- methylaminomethyl-2-thiouridine (mnm(5)s(2)U) at the wobble position (U34) in tRNA. Catalyzes the FAD-dependent demodification of cmnm(5)s(2)U34 to nm(5)s(2)U34 [Seminavis robusta]|uniref:4a-hydroxytetrahydrobiopterin dehydratase n=1 Tax=Seminavis robusta TaxID=568900 RepID=A0A9N8HR85_9STRA|nr:Catalyzes the last two steps in the biosynthesis of 5- methylaminomethyl-2-thiouridine (mnm(5)s(2)U) at the wobble position (U34) in tRNA. Catalyzes the FAD-dependent demodification of cmnm(5)s(2)U34 to nm(5)s(2)U34 [Seminavis robusta]|eukprot:Sro1537_g280700.1 Catalyzes the last two steps in the biosynthesis of 5- methylaminomethyl-2-thiouridine (mnm(5)s(2)U) at the wobble position (U34) in tRNA. Catalyzes the FAD-dependent demodification of cmnm(5)s(2)U34 to nm(5)s(2)U34 (108) ;mRNA; f:20286-20728